MNLHIAGKVPIYSYVLWVSQRLYVGEPNNDIGSRLPANWEYVSLYTFRTTY